MFLRFTTLSHLSAVRSKLPDLVILDVMLPILDGLGVCRIIRKEPMVTHTPIIILTAPRAVVDMIVGLESGADDYLMKPFGLGEFLARVRAVLRRAPRAGSVGQQDELVANGLRMDLAGRSVFWATPNCG